MKTARRHELRENDLAQQIEAIAAVLRRHKTLTTLAMLGVVVLTVGGVLYASHRAEARRDAWQLLSDAPRRVAQHPEDRFTRYRELADRKISLTITALALKRAADAAVEAMTAAKGRRDFAQADQWAEKARTTYQYITDEFGTVVPALAAARFGQAFLAEERGAYEDARNFYLAIRDDARYQNSPYAVQAQYRLSRLDDWKQRFTFAPATQPAADTASAEAVTPPGATPQTGRRDEPSKPRSDKAAEALPAFSRAPEASATAGAASPPAATQPASRGSRAP